MISLLRLLAREIPAVAAGFTVALLLDLRGASWIPVVACIAAWEMYFRPSRRAS